MNTLAQLKKNRQQSLSQLTKSIEQMNGPAQQQNGPDEKLWKPSVGKDGNGYAVIRFMPPPKGEDVPFVRMWDHGFQGPGGWYIEKSLTTLGQQDPVSEYNTKLWSTGREEDKATVRQQKRRLSFYANIYVVKDPDNPQNEGKVFLYKFGKRIFDKLNDLMNPQFEDEKPVNPFDFWEGANFRLKIRKVDGYWNYDKSEFDSPSQLADDDDLEGIWEQQHSLSDLVDPKNFKTYEELEARLNKVLNIGSVATPPPAPKPAPQPKVEDDDHIPFEVDPPSNVQPTADSEEEDDLAFFKSLAED